jgi:serine protease Do
VIGAVDPSSDAAAKGLQRGDVIISVNYKPAASATDISAAASAAKTAGRSNVLLFVQRGNGPARYLAVKLKQG